MSTPASKRRRLDGSSSSTPSALHRPFRTPLKRPAREIINIKNENENENENETETTTDLESTTTRGCVKRNGYTNTPSQSSDRSSRNELVNNVPEAHVSETSAAVIHGQSTTSCNQRGHPAVLTPSCSTTTTITTRKLAPVPDPAITAAQKQQRTLEQQQRSVRADIDVLEQALRVARRRRRQRQDEEEKKKSKNKMIKNQEMQLNQYSEDATHQCEKQNSVNGDVRLENLIIKWRDASRRAVEEVFAGARDRVNRMGGVAAWKEREREKLEQQQQGSSWGWDVAGAGAGADAAKDSTGGDDDDDDGGGDQGQYEDRIEEKEEESKYDKLVKEEEEEERALQEAASGFDNGNVSELSLFLFIYLFSICQKMQK